MRRILLLLTVLALTFTVTACGGGDKEKDDKALDKAQKQVEEKVSDGEVVKYDNLGLEYTMPKVWKDNEASNVLNYDIVGGGKNSKEEALYGLVQFNYLPESALKSIQEKAKSAKTEEDQMKLMTELMSNQTPLCRVVILNTDKATEQDKKDVFKGFKLNEKIAELDGREYYFLYNDKYDEAEKGLSEEDKALFKEMYSEIDNVKKSIKAIKVVTDEDKMATETNVGAFKTTDLDGNEVSNETLKDYKLTMFNIWETTCGPCIQEMPELQTLAEEVKKDNVNVMGIVIDATNKDLQETAKIILEKKGAKFPNLIPDENLQKGILSKVVGTPTTIFVDSKGNIIGEAVIGSKDKDFYKTKVEEALKSIK